ncbi:RICIN domain-containing protein [Amycolatopsis sp. 195334CR]|uniref:RICIN domain-containing protein n=1 Tax=Amycolatopsis sp. 195334CR TaxID=2814588 RepID=UPI001A902E3F|nr:hypothetical protein [Amycolatopsis sp. 195334CR]MBN6042119.1 hypothetical protein [Amycolatopsis sp. 195334CR]
MGRRIRSLALAFCAFTALGTTVANAAPADTPTTFCSLRGDDYYADCMRVAFGLTRGELSPSTVFDWHFTGTGAANTYTIQPRDFPGYCVMPSGVHVDAAVVLHPCDSRQSQRWVVETHHSAGPFDLYHPLRNQFTGLHLTFVNVGGNPIVQRPFVAQDQQYFARLGPAV